MLAQTFPSGSLTKGGLHLSTTFFKMADKIRLPSSGGGLVNYSDEYKTKFSFSPVWIVVFIVVVIAMEYVLHTLF